jgi:hypothetical protein
LTTEAKRRRRNRLRIALDCVSVLLLFAVGAPWFALQEKKQADKAAARARIEEDRSWIEGAKLKSARGDHFAAVLMAARALGFAGYGQEKGSGAIPRKCMFLPTNGFLGFMPPRLRTKARERLLFFRSAV